MDESEHLLTLTRLFYNREVKRDTKSFSFFIEIKHKEEVRKHHQLLSFYEMCYLQSFDINNLILVDKTDANSTSYPLSNYWPG